jgi:Co/Zn/Cd efflux system component
VAGNCCSPGEDAREQGPGWRRALWIALLVNASMFVLELAAGAAADSRSLQADALDFFGDATNYAISLLVAGMALQWRSWAAMLKGVTLLGLGAFVLVTAAVAALNGSAPEPRIMGTVGVLAFIANVSVALMLYRFRGGDANMQSVWICSRNDAVGNFAVVLAAAGVFGTGSAIPDLVVAAILASLGISGGIQIVRQSYRELRSGRLEGNSSLRRPDEVS